MSILFILSIFLGVMIMKPRTEATSFGSITIDGEKYRHDVLITVDGAVQKRKKKLSKEVFGTSHKISLAEAEYIYEKDAEVLVVGTGQFDQVRLSEEAQSYFESKGLKAIMKRTPAAIRLWNEIQEKAIGLFHLTC
jgi:hypothetical protein